MQRSALERILDGLNDRIPAKAVAKPADRLSGEACYLVPGLWADPFRLVAYPIVSPEREMRQV
jgi:hypothetical protein